MTRAMSLHKAMPLVGIILFSLLFLTSASYFVVAAFVDAQTLSIRFELNKRKAGTSNLDPIQWTRIQLGLNEATSIVYDGAYYWEDLGYLYASRGYAALSFPFIAMPLLEKGVYHYQKSVLTRPMSPVARANLALMYHYLNNDKLIWKNYEYARRYGAHDPTSRLTLFLICVQRWKNLPEDKRIDVIAFYNSSPPSLKGKLREMLQNAGIADF